MSSFQDDVKEILSAAENNLAQVWSEIGLSEEEKANQLHILLEQINAVVNAKIDTENNLLYEYKIEITRLINESRMIADQIERADLLTQEFLDIESSSPNSSTLSLNQKLTVLRSCHESLSSIKSNIVNEVQTILTEYHAICKELGIVIHPEFTEVGSKLAGRVEACKEKLQEASSMKMNQIKMVHVLINEIRLSIKELEPSPSSLSDLDRMMMDPSTNPSTVGIDMKSMEMLSKRSKELNAEKDQRVEILRGLAKKIKSLWEKLEVDTAYRNEFLTKNDGVSYSTMVACEAELARLNELKSTKMDAIIISCLEMIKAEWKELKMSENEMADEERKLKELSASYQDDKDKVLEMMERELENLKEQVKAMAPLLGLAEKYLELVHEREEYDALIQDSSRLLSRKGGSKLKEEEKMRIRVTKDLPALIVQLRETVSKYESTCNKVFNFNGVPFLNDILEKTETKYKEDQIRVREEKKHKTSSTSASASTTVRAPLAQVNGNRKLGR